MGIQVAYKIRCTTCQWEGDIEDTQPKLVVRNGGRDEAHELGCPICDSTYLSDVLLDE